MSPHSKEDLIAMMDQLLVELDAGRTNEPRAWRVLSYL
jgi:hypothetical protein